MSGHNLENGPGRDRCRGNRGNGDNRNTSNTPSIDNSPLLTNSPSPLPLRRRIRSLSLPESYLERLNHEAATGIKTDVVDTSEATNTGYFSSPGPEPDVQIPHDANALDEHLGPPENFEDTTGDILPEPAAAAAAATTEVSAAATVPEAASAPYRPPPLTPQGSIVLRKLPFHPDSIKKGIKKAVKALTVRPPTAESFTTKGFTADTVDNMAGPSRPSQLRGSAPAFVSQADRDPAAQLQDLFFQPGGIPDLLPHGPTEMAGLDPHLLANGPPPPTEPLGDLETQFRAIFAPEQITNAAEAEEIPEKVVGPTKLVVVCCLATWMGTRDTDDKWVAMPAQGVKQGWGLDMVNSSERECWRMHIWKGLEVLKQMDGEGVLMFSGGPWTEASEISAAKSYHDFAKASNFWGYLRGDKYKDYPSRIFTEDRAMDSLQQIMFSLTEFNNRYSNFPEEMSVISYELKRERFEKLHFKTAKELMLPSAQPRIDVSWQGTPTFIGIDPRELKQYAKFEKVKALMDLEAQIFDIWKGSPFGLSRVLMDRKKKRNVRNIDVTYKLVIAAGPELVAALEKNVKEAPIEEVVDLSVN